MDCMSSVRHLQKTYLLTRSHLHSYPSPCLFTYTLSPNPIDENFGGTSLRWFFHLSVQTSTLSPVPTPNSKSSTDRRPPPSTTVDTYRRGLFSSSHTHLFSVSSLHPLHAPLSAPYAIESSVPSSLELLLPSPLSTDHRSFCFRLSMTTHHVTLQVDPEIPFTSSIFVLESHQVSSLPPSSSFPLSPPARL